MASEGESGCFAGKNMEGSAKPLLLELTNALFTCQDNIPLNKFELTGIELALRGVSEVKPSFQIDANGILNVEAEVSLPALDIYWYIANIIGMFESDDQVVYYARVFSRYAGTWLSTKLI